MKKLRYITLFVLAAFFIPAPILAQTPNIPNTPYMDSLQHWSAVYGVSASCEIAIVNREDSFWDPKQYNLQGSGAYGLPQFEPDGVWLLTPLGRSGRSVYSTTGDEQLEMMSWVIANVGTSPWSPSPC